MQSKHITLSCLALILVVGFGCSKGKELKKSLVHQLREKGLHPAAHPEEFAAAAIQKMEETGITFTQQVEAVQKGDWIDECDDKLKDKRFEIAKYLDDNYALVRAFYNEASATTGNGTEVKYIQIGKLRSRVTAPNNSDDQWVTELSTNWQDMHEHYLQIKDIKFTSDSPLKEKKYLVSLYKDFLAIIVDDEGRATDGINYYLTHDDLPKIKSAAEKVEACITNNCERPEFTTDDLEFILSVRFYRRHWQRYLSTNDRTRLTKLLNELTWDFGRYEVRTNKSVTLENLKYTLPLFLKPELVEGKDLLAKVIEDIWKNEKGEHLKVDYFDQHPDIFSVFVDNVPGRSYVMFKAKEVHLLQDVKDRSIAHEIGHVLGFRDQYYTLWDQDKCLYSIESNAADIMAISSGRVLPYHWEALKQTYAK